MTATNNIRHERVSVVMCTYNGMAFLREQLDSVLAVDYPLHEIIIQDDGSTDGTRQLLQDYATRHNNIRLFFNEQCLGFNRNFHTAALKAEGDFIALCDQDDIWFPQKIRRQIETIGQADLCISAYYTDPEYKEPLHVLVKPRTDFEHILFYDCTPGHTMLMRRDFFHSIKHWDYMIYYDWWISFHALMGHGIRRVDEPLNWHRHYVGSATTRVKKRGRWEPADHPTWQPYLLGYFHRRHLQKKHNFNRLYHYLADHIDAELQPVPARMARLMTKPNIFSTLRLCALCGRHYDRVYPGNPTGLKGRIRGFFYPFISAYGCDLFKLEKQ